MFGEQDAAREELQAALRLDPSLARAYGSLGVLAAAGGDSPEAVRLWTRALELDPRDVDSRLTSGRCSGARAGGRMRRPTSGVSSRCATVRLRGRRRPGPRPLAPRDRDRGRAIACAVALLLTRPLPAAETRYVLPDEAASVLQAMHEALPPGSGRARWRRAGRRLAGVGARTRPLGAGAPAEASRTPSSTCSTSAARSRARRASPPETRRRLGQAGSESALARRIDDLVTALLKPGGDERLSLARSALGLGPVRSGPVRAGREGRRGSPLGGTAFARGRGARPKEQAAFASELARIRALPDTTEQLAARATLFRERGISLDTSLRPAFAIEEGLRDALGRGQLAAGSVRRVAVIGPGLDFVEKAEGQDFYPPQSLQCLAIADSLVRLGLSSPGSLSVTALDISPRVLDHLGRARARALAGEGYPLQLPRPREGWGSALVGYWERFGGEIGAAGVAVTPPPIAGDVVVRAVTVRPPVVASVQTHDLNVVYQRRTCRRPNASTS